MDYEELERRLQFRKNSPACMIVLSRSGRHEFGGERRDLVISGAQLPKPIHHFLTLDTADPLCPVTSDYFSKLPLIYPLLYGVGGGEIQYSVLANDRIDIHHLSDFDEDIQYVEHEALPARRARLRKLTYGEERLICALSGDFSARKFSMADKLRLKRCHYGELWRVGGHFQTRQGPVWSLCMHRECTWRDSFGGSTQSGIRPLAIISASRRQIGDVWGEYSDDVEFYFGYCPHCHSIHAVNRCG